MADATPASETAIEVIASGEVPVCTNWETCKGYRLMR
jgi:hypothetical protein